MLYHILYSLRESFSALNVFKYLTFRASLAIITSFLLSVILGPYLIRRLQCLKIGENVERKHCQALNPFINHKQGTPTMGGILIVSSVIVSTLFWADLSNIFIRLCILLTLWLGLLGTADDIAKLRKKSSGLSKTSILAGQITIAVIISAILFAYRGFDSAIYVPFFKNFVIQAGFWFILFAVLVIVGSSNAVNLTDGLDGLAAGTMIMVSLAYMIFSYISGNKIFSEYLLLPFNPGVGEVTVFCAAILGAVLGFLWFNCYPATVFMGNVGSLTLGGAIGLVAVIIKQEFVLLLVGAIFVVEAISVITQVLSYKLRKKRVFKMAPLHHHFQLMGWPESKIIVRFWIVSAICVLIALATLKLR